MGGAISKSTTVSLVAPGRRIKVGREHSHVVTAGLREATLDAIAKVQAER